MVEHMKLSIGVIKGFSGMDKITLLYIAYFMCGSSSDPTDQLGLLVFISNTYGVYIKDDEVAIFTQNSTVRKAIDLNTRLLVSKM